MRYTRPVIEGFGYALAPVVVSTEEIEERLAPVYEQLKVAQGQLEHLTGIVERRWWEPGYPVSQGAILAARNALEHTAVSPADVEVLLYGAVCRENFEPATACDVAAGLERAGLAISPGAVIHDVSNACLGVLTGLVDVANRIELGQVRAGMVVACETAREINEIAIARLLEDPTMQRFKASVATFTGGSGAVAVLLTDGSFEAKSRRLRGASVQAAPAHHQLCQWGVDAQHGMFARTDSAAVLEHGVKLGLRTWESFLAEQQWAAAEVDRVVCHQIGAAHRQAMLPLLGVPLDKDFVAYEDLGNTGTVALPLAAALAQERGFLQPGHRVGLLGIGSGLNCMMLGVDW